MSRLRPWTRYWWGIAAGGVVVTLTPIAIASLGLLLGSQYLQTYHWLTYYSAPVGLPVAIIAGLVALIRTAVDLRR